MVKKMKKIWKLLFLIFMLTACEVKPISNSTTAKVYYHYKTVEPYIALTFDDGPDKIQTIKVLDILKKYDIKATFFVIGEKIEYQKSTLKKVYEAGHEIGNHFYTHDNIKKLSKEEIRENIVKCNELIFSVTGKMPKVVRPPYGFVTDNLKKVCAELNMSIIIWTDNKDSRDWELIKDSEIINNVTKKVSNGDIFLFHDGSKKYTNTLSAIDVIIPSLENKGFKWVTVSEMIKK